MKSYYFLLLVLLSVSTVGCQTSKLGGTFPWSKPADEVAASEKPEKADNETTELEFQEPTRMVAVWKDGTFDSADGKMIRGLAGRVYFYNGKDEIVPVDGSLTVYGFPESHEIVSSEVQPEKKFAFRQEEFQTHYSKSEIGDSYSFWLPWGEVGSYRKAVSILPIFRSAAGRIVKGELVNAGLPGPKDPAFETSVRELRSKLEDGQFAKQVIYESENYDQQLEGHNGLRTKTISIPSEATSIQNALQQSQQEKILTGRDLQNAINQTGSPLKPVGDKVNTDMPSSLNQKSEATQTGFADNGYSNKHWNATLNAFRRSGPKVNSGLPGVARVKTAPESLNQQNQQIQQ